MTDTNETPERKPIICAHITNPKDKDVENRLNQMRQEKNLIECFYSPLYVTLASSDDEHYDPDYENRLMTDDEYYKYKDMVIQDYEDYVHIEGKFKRLFKVCESTKEKIIDGKDHVEEHNNKLYLKMEIMLNSALTEQETEEIKDALTAEYVDSYHQAFIPLNDGTTSEIRTSVDISDEEFFIFTSDEFIKHLSDGQNNGINQGF